MSILFQMAVNGKWIWRCCLERVDTTVDFILSRKLQRSWAGRLSRIVNSLSDETEGHQSPRGFLYIAFFFLVARFKETLKPSPNVSETNMTS